MIPKIIHQIWLGPSPAPTKWLKSWEDKHPDWEYILWTEENCPKLRNEMAFSRAPEYNRKANILRYELLLDYGGVYIDADMLCLKSINPLVDNIYRKDFFAAKEKKGSNLIANSVIGCSKKHRYMKLLVDNIQHDLSRPSWVVTGPKYLTDMIQKHKFDMDIFPPEYFYPFHHSDGFPDLNSPKCKNSYGLHYWGTTHNRFDAGR